MAGQRGIEEGVRERERDGDSTNEKGDEATVYGRGPSGPSDRCIKVSIWLGTHVPFNS